MLPPIAFDINGIKDKLSNQFRPWQRSFQFWVRAIDIYTGYKVSHSLSFSQHYCCIHLFHTCFLFNYFIHYCSGVSSESEFRQRCAEAGSNVGEAARACRR